MSTKIINDHFDYHQYAKNMRNSLSNDEIKKDDGLLNHKYFLVKKGSYWSEINQKNLYRGLENWGVGKWAKIKSFLLNDFSELEIELRSCMLLGINNLKDYEGQKLSLDQIEEEREKNIREGTEKNKIKNNIFMKYLD